MTGLPTAAYTVRGGEDVDEDQFYCELGDACGYWGGPTEDDAVLLFVDTALPAVTGIDIVIAPP